VSSSGHLVLGAHLLGFREPHLLFDLALHLGTLIATVAFFRQSFIGMARESFVAIGDLRGGASPSEVLVRRPDVRLLYFVILGSIPTALFGVVFKDPLERMFGDAHATAWQLLITAGLLLVPLAVKRSGRDIQAMSAWDALFIGLLQGISIVPGISRSGATIAGGLMLGLDRELAARYSFVMSVPAIAGAFVLKATDATAAPFSMSIMVVGALTAGITGFSSLAFLMPVVRRGRIHLFALYLVPVSVLALWLLA
jgi:undecaprenyl-diphosphatase